MNCGLTRLQLAPPPVSVTVPETPGTTVGPVNVVMTVTVCDVVALLAKGGRSTKQMPSKALVRNEPQELAPRRLFSDVAEPLGTLLRIGVLSLGVGGSVGMASIRVSLLLTIYVIAIFGFPARKKVLGVGHELDSMLAEGQGGFTDMMKSAMARR